MSDYDRGAYAPQGEAPLSFDGGGFDPRSRRRRPFPMALIGSGVVLLLLVTALIMFVKGGSKEAGAARPLGGVAAIKTAPTGPQPTDPATGLDIYTPQNVPSSAPANTVAEGGAPAQAAAGPAPRFAPAPEQPMARPAPPPPPVAVAKTVPPPVRAEPLRAAKPGAAATAAAAPSAKVANAAPVRPTPEPSARVAAEDAAPAKVAAEPAAKRAALPSAAEKKPAPVKLAKAKLAPVADEDSAEAADDSHSDAVTTLLRPASTFHVTASSRAKPTASVRTAAVAKTLPAKPESTLAAKSATTKLAKLPAKPATKGKSVAMDDADDEADPSAPPASALPRGALAPSKPAIVASTKASGGGGGYTVQVGAFPSAADAEKGAATATTKVATGAGKARRVETVQKNGKTLYRSTLKGFGSKTEAAAFCAALRAKGGQCLIRAGG